MNNQNQQLQELTDKVASLEKIISQQQKDLKRIKMMFYIADTDLKNHLDMLDCLLYTSDAADE